MSTKDSPRCDRCLFQNETLVHMYCECPDVKIFWKDVIMWWNTKRPDDINPNSIEILYDQSETPSLQVFLALLESKIKCERQMAIKNSNCKKYRAKWTTLRICDARASYFYVFKRNQTYSVPLNIQ